LHLKRPVIVFLNIKVPAMNPDTLQKVIRLAENLEYFLIATVSPEGQPHIAAAGAHIVMTDAALEKERAEYPVVTGGKERVMTEPL
jgi:hypothetical protein